MHLYTDLSKLEGPIITSLLVKKMSASYLLAVMFRRSVCRIPLLPYLFFVYESLPTKYVLDKAAFSANLIQFIIIMPGIIVFVL